MGDTVVNVTNLNEIERIPTDHKEFKVFFSYRDTTPDRAWVQDVVSYLEKEHNLRCCDHLRDFIPGRSIIENIYDFVPKSSKAVIVLSTEYHKSDWCKYETDILLHMNITSRANVIIPVIIEDVNPQQVPEHMKHLTYIDCRGEKQIWLPKLLAAIKYSSDSKNTDMSNHNLVDVDKNYKNLDEVHKETATSSCCCVYPYKMSFTRKYLPEALDMKGLSLDLHVNDYVRKDLEQTFSKQFCCNPLMIFIPVFLLSASSFLVFIIFEAYGFINLNIVIIIVGFAVGGYAFGVDLVCIAIRQYYWSKDRGSKSQLHLRIMKILKPYNLMCHIQYTASFLNMYTQQKITQRETQDAVINIEGFDESSNEETCLNMYTSQGHTFTKRLVASLPTTQSQFMPDNKNQTVDKKDDSLLIESLSYITDFHANKLENGSGKRHCKRAICLCEYIEQKGLI